MSGADSVGLQGVRQEAEHVSPGGENQQLQDSGSEGELLSSTSGSKKPHDADVPHQRRGSATAITGG